MDASLVAWARNLAGMAPQPALLTLSLDVDGARRPRIADCVSAFDSLSHVAKDAADRIGVEATESVTADLARLRAFVEEIDRDGDTRGLFAVASAAAGVFEARLLPLPVADHASVGDRPRLVELSQVADWATTSVVALVDRERCRIFTALGGALRERANVVDPGVRRHDQGGWSAANLQRHADELARRHLQRASDAVEAELRSHPGAPLLVGGSADDLAVFTGELRLQGRARLAGRFAARVDAGVEEIGPAVGEVLARLAAERDAQAVSELRDAVGEERGVLGLQAALTEVSDGRCARIVATVPAANDAVVPAWRCTGCEVLSATEECGRCGARCEPVADALDALVSAALRSGCGVSWVDDRALLDDAGGAGAILRY